MESMKQKFLADYKEHKDTCSILEVFVTVPGCDAPEIIINSKCNIPVKMEYYENAYDEKLVNKHCDKVKIIKWKFY